jgi:site-specific DNA-methyltransferase (adenine-specific)
MSGIETHAGDCRDVLATLPADSVDSVVTDPPYELAFMGRGWDSTGVAFDPNTWRAVYRVLKPGAHLLAFGGTRTSHRMVCAIEDAGFEVRDTLCWLYGSGFPKSHDVSKHIDRAAGAERELKTISSAGLSSWKVENGGQANHWVAAAKASGEKTVEVWGDEPMTDAARQWTGWGTALKPAHEPIVLARKPLVGTVAANVLAHGTGAINVDACRIGTSKDVPASPSGQRRSGYGFGLQDGTESGFDPNIGRWPANVLHDGSPEVEAAFAMAGERTTTWVDPSHANNRTGEFMRALGHPGVQGFNDTGSASRFFYCAKADSGDRADSRHPTIKPVDLMRWLVRLITPPGGTVLDPFAGSGTTGEAAMLEGMGAILIEQDAQHVADIRHRQARWSGADLPLFTSWPPADDPADTLMADLFAGHGT